MMFGFVLIHGGLKKNMDLPHQKRRISWKKYEEIIINHGFGLAPSSQINYPPRPN
jgi:hypothetical protein